MKKVIQGRIFYSRTYLVDKVNISARTVEKWNEGKILEAHESWYCLESIPAQSRQKITAYESVEKLQYLAYGYNEDFARFLLPIAEAGVKPSKR